MLKGYRTSEVAKGKARIELLFEALHAHPIGTAREKIRNLV